MDIKIKRPILSPTLLIHFAQQGQKVENCSEHQQREMQHTGMKSLDVTVSHFFLNNFTKVFSLIQFKRSQVRKGILFFNISIHFTFKTAGLRIYKKF